MRVASATSRYTEFLEDKDIGWLVFYVGLILLLILLIGLFFILLVQDMMAFGVMPEGTVIAGVPVGGLTKGEAEAKCERELAYVDERPLTITVDGGKVVSDGLTFQLKVEGDAAKAGFADNLIVEASAEYEVTITNRQTGKTTKQKRRDSLGTLPAIPFVVVQP